MFFGFQQPIVELMGYGNALHDIVRNINIAAINGTPITEDFIKDTFDQVFYLPYAISTQQQRLLESAKRSITKYVEHNRDTFDDIGEIEKELKSKKYGLVWEEHEEAVDVKMHTHIPVFTEDKSMEINADTSTERYNFLLEGDNLHSLRLLEKTHRGKIDVIYIDPPYNTGSRDFRYDDAFVDTLDGFRHSKWISFMEKRLFVAKALLKSTGVIFISIDDNECAQLKLLCDEIFGEDCFVADVSWQRSYSPRNDSKGIVCEVEHLIVYSKLPDWQPRRLPRTEEMNSKYKNPL